MKTVTRDQYDAFVRSLPRNVEWRPTESTSQCVMQIIGPDNILLAQAIYTNGGPGAKVSIEYQIN